MRKRVELRGLGDIIAVMMALSSRARRPLARRAAFALALAAASALTPPALAELAAHPPSPPVASAAAVDGAHAVDHAERADQSASRKGPWGALAGAVGGVLAAIGGGLGWLRHLAGSRVVRPVLKAAAATARVAFGGASAMANAGLWIGRAIWGVAAGAVALVAAIFGLANGGAGAALVTGLALGVGIAAAAFWAARRYSPLRHFRRKPA
jgi:hypothetical protein